MLLLKFFLVILFILSCSDSFKIYLDEQNQQDYALLINVKYRGKDHTVKMVNNSIHKFNISLGFFDCQNDENKDCLHQFRFVRAVIYSLKSASIVKTLNEKQLKDTNSLIRMLLLNSQLDHGNLFEVKNSATWRFIKEKDKNSKNYVIVKLKQKSSALYRFVMEQSKQISATNTRFLFTLDEEVAYRITGVDIDENQVCLMKCRNGQFNKKCYLKRFQHLPYFERIENAINKLNNNLYFKFIEEESEIPVLKSEVLKANFSLLIFEVGETMVEKAKRIASESCLTLLDNCDCFIFERKDANSTQQIKLRIYSNLLNTDVLLSAENPDEVNYHANRAVLMQDHGIFGEIYQQTGGRPDEKHLIQETGLYHHFFTAGNEIDCPMSYSAAKSRFLQDLIWKDKKGRKLPRVSDVSYEKLMSGGDFQVLLFTLIHNPRSMAALAHFYDIHQYYLKNKLTSPLMWVECSDWPDVCQLADVTTYPTMIFVRNHDRGVDDVTTTTTRYDGMWDLDEMTKSIVLHGLKWPMSTEASQLDRFLSRFPFPVVCGNVRSISGEEMFRDAALKLGRDAVFIKLSNNDDDSDDDSFMIYMNGNVVTSSRPFSSVDDVEVSLKSVMKPSTLIELDEKTFYKTFQSYQQEDDRKIVVVPINKLSPSYNEQQKLLKLVEKVARMKNEQNSKLLFTWMQCEPESSGDYIFQIYTNSNIPPVSIACVLKENATVTPFEEVEFEGVRDWVQRCENSQLPPTFTKLKTNLQQLTSSDDHLRFYRLEGITPPFDESEQGKLPDEQSEDSTEGRNEDPHPHTEL